MSRLSALPKGCPMLRGRKVLKRAPRPLIGVLQRSLMEMPERDLGLLRKQLGSVIDLMGVTDKSAGKTPLSDL